MVVKKIDREMVRRGYLFEDSTMGLTINPSGQMLVVQFSLSIGHECFVLQTNGITIKYRSFALVGACLQDAGALQLI